QRIRRRALDDRAKRRTELGGDAAVLLAAEQNVLRAILLPGELPQQIADVRADAIIAQLARIDRNSHGRNPTMTRIDAKRPMLNAKRAHTRMRVCHLAFGIDGQPPLSPRYRFNSHTHPGWCFS